MDHRYHRTPDGTVMDNPQSDWGKSQPAVVVIDPNNDAEVRALADAWSNSLGIGATPTDGRVDRFRKALRKLLTPPRPPEPTELGHVLTDRHGNKWVRADWDRTPWFRPGDHGETDWVAYDQIDLP